MKKKKLESHKEFNKKSKKTIEQESVTPITNSIPPNIDVMEPDDLDTKQLLELTGYDLTNNNSIVTSSLEKIEEVKKEVKKSLYDMKQDLIKTYDKTFTSGLNTI